MLSILVSYSSVPYVHMRNPFFFQKTQSPQPVIRKGCTQIDVDVIATDAQVIAKDLLEASEYARKMGAAEIEAGIYRIVDEHDDDPNFPTAILDAANRYLFDHDLKKRPAEFQRLYEELKVQAAMIAINSPYAEVRAVVDNHDDPHVPVSTFRTWVIGTILVVAGAILNQFFSIRSPSINVGSNVAQIVAVPLLKMMELLPNIEFVTFGYVWSLNPGPFNQKEHILITIMANVGFNTPYTDAIVLVQYSPLYFNQTWAIGFGYQLLVGLSTNLIGYGLAGLTRRFLVYPAHAICFICNSLSLFNWMTWISPTNVSLAAITGSFGLGFNPLPTFDWNVITTAVNPLVMPFFANNFQRVRSALFTFPIIAVLWYTNTWNTGYLPINSNIVFDNTGNLYSVANTLGSDKLFNQTMYEAYSPAYLSASNALIYGVFFALYMATLSHTFLYNRREIMLGFRSIFSRERASQFHKDVHVRLMESYKEVPEWQYFIVLIFAIVIGAVGLGVYPTNTSPFVVVSGVFLAVVFVIPVGIIMSITNVEITLNVLAEFFGGLWFPGNAIAMNYFKMYGYMTTSQTISFAADLKLAHYMHIPPLLTFSAQIYATVLSTFVCTAILNFEMTKVCTLDRVNHVTCPDMTTFFTASVFWGTLGPKRMCGPGGIYNGLLWGFLIGSILPIAIYFLRKKVKMLAYLHVPVLLSGGRNWGPYSLANIWPAVPIGYLFNVFIKRRHVAWWTKYNYVTSAAFSAAVSICGIVIFFAIERPGVQLSWSGNTRPFEGCDARGCARLPLPSQGFFGPGVGEFH
ncbi:OPT-domain-containing protein [Mycena galopus ATCC 62051]|nr:OPT-domain-containing protein [Mycena galopus ATCC 62051]